MNHLVVLTIEYADSWGSTRKASRASTVAVTPDEPAEYWFQWAFDQIVEREGFDPYAGFVIIHWNITPCGNGEVDFG